MAIVIPDNLTNVDEPPYLGSFQQLLASNIGNRVRIDFMIGSSNMTSQTGIIYAATSQYVVLRSLTAEVYVACDNFSIKFITFI